MSEWSRSDRRTRIAVCRNAGSPGEAITCDITIRRHFEHRQMTPCACSAPFHEKKVSSRSA
ncbi:hypothetical protein FJZ36_05965 [Candidatus Poribacteria bacterium]|nr:hypothetical protein [Candidatus Poribacteria bacterium]